MSNLFPMNRERLLANIREADNEDLLQRVTIMRAGMEPEALQLIEEELTNRGITRNEIEAYHQESMGKVLVNNNDIAWRCSFCGSPATREGWGWHCLFGRIPIFPRFYHCCDNHPIPYGQSKKPG